MTEPVKRGKGPKRIGVFLLISGLLLANGLRAFMGESILLESFLVIMFSGGTFLYWRCRQWAAKARAVRVIGDSKPDVLYLRAFEKDLSTRDYVLLSALMPITSSVTTMVTQEDQLSEVLQPFGDLVAIGKPSETLPTPGAARLYVSDTEWRKVVTDQMQKARLVVIRAGSGEGLLWELKQAAHLLNPKQLLILIFGIKKRHYEAFRKEADQIFECTFPEAFVGFVRFSANWKPSFLPLRTPPYFRQNLYRPYLAKFQFTLRPVFEEYGLEWQPPPVSASNCIALFGIVLFVGLVFVPAIADNKLLMACAMLVGVAMLYKRYKKTSQRRSFSPAVSRNIVVAIIALFVWLTETYVSVQLEQPDTLTTAFWIVLFPAVFVAFVWANWPLFHAISGAWRSVLHVLTSTAIFCLWYFACVSVVYRFLVGLLAAA